MAMQIRRTETTGSAGEPTGLQPGQLSVQMHATAPKLWVGVPVGIAANRRILLAEGAVSGAYMPLSGGTVTNTLNIGTGLTAPAGGAQAGDLNARRVLVNGVSVLTLTGGTLNGSLTVGSPQAPSVGMQTGDLNVQRIYVGGQPLSAPGSYLALSGGTLYNTGQAAGWGQGPLIVEAAGAPSTYAELVLRIRSGPYAFSLGTTPASHFAIHNVTANNDPLTIWGGNETATGSVFINRNGLVVGAPSNGSMGVGTLNVQNGIYINGQPLSGPGAYVPNDRASTITGDADLLTLHTGAGANNRLIFDNQSTNGPRRWALGTGPGGNFNIWDLIYGSAVISIAHPDGIAAGGGNSNDLRLHQGNLDFYNSAVDWQYITRSAARPNLAFCVDNPIDGPLQWFKVIANHSHFTGNIRSEGQIHANRTLVWDTEYPGHVAGDNPLLVYASAGHLARIEYYVEGQVVWQVGVGAAGNWTIGEGQSQAGTFMARMAVFRNDAGRYIDFNSNNAYVVFNTPIYAHNGTTLGGHLWVIGDDGLHIDSYGYLGGHQWARISYSNDWSTWRAGVDPNGDFRISDEGGYGYVHVPVGYRFTIKRDNGPIEVQGPVYVYNHLGVYSGNLVVSNAMVAYTDPWNIGWSVEVHNGFKVLHGCSYLEGAEAGGWSLIASQGIFTYDKAHISGSLGVGNNIDCAGVIIARGHDSSAGAWGVIVDHGVHAYGNGYFGGTVTIGNNLNMSGNIACNFVTTNEMYANGGTSSFHNLAARGNLSVGWGLTVGGGITVNTVGINTNAAIACHVGNDGVVNAAGVHIYSGRLWVDNCLDCRTDGSARILNGDWYVNGHLSAASGISDVRAKRDIEDWSGGLAIVEQLRPVQYHLIRDGQFRHGLVAQEVEPLLPEAVYECSFDGMKYLEYDEITTALVDAVRELSERLKAAEDTIHRLTRSIH